MASWKVEICLKKKNPPRAQIFRNFRIESRNNKELWLAESFLHFQFFAFEGIPKFRYMMQELISKNEQVKFLCKTIQDGSGMYRPWNAQICSGKVFPHHGLI